MQANINKLSSHYFRTPENYFWKWAEYDAVIEWVNGTTICYWEEVLEILKALAPQGLPPFASVVLGIAMCQDNWQNSRGKEKILLEIIAQQISKRPTAKKKSTELLQTTFQLMDQVSSLEKSLRSGPYRIHLLKEIFKEASIRIPYPQSKQIIDAFEAGTHDFLEFKGGGKVRYPKLKTDLSALANAATQFPTEEALTNFLRTGVDIIPEPLEIDIPEEPGDILEALAADTQTLGIAQLTKRLIAALHIPMQTEGISDQAFGGISDITNRGSFDKLLLSELAQDNEALTARLVNNEALYYHHEEPPTPLNRNRVILMDTTLKMWGLPRLFALSAAIACARSIKENIKIGTFSINGATKEVIDLTTKKGVLKAMEQIDGSLDCLSTLLPILADKTNNQEEEEEYIFITNESTLNNPNYYTQLEIIQQALDYLITVNRNGALHFYHCINGRRKLLSAPVFDLKKVLFPKKTVPKLSSVITSLLQHKEQPAFLKQQPAFVLFPTEGINKTKNKAFIVEGQVSVQQVLLVNAKQRLLKWFSAKKGAIELLQHIEKGAYCFGSDGAAILLLVYSSNIFVLYHIQEEKIISRKDFSHKYTPNKVFFKEGFFYFKHKEKMYRLNKDGTIIKVYEADKILSLFFDIQETEVIPFAKAKKFINNGYSVLQRVSRIGINNMGELLVGKHYLAYRNGEIILETPPALAVNLVTNNCLEYDDLASLTGNEQVKFRRFKWADGSTAIIDGRGLLHLKSSNTELEEVTIVLVLNNPVACWASNGAFSGNPYFFKHIDKAYISYRVFYDAYIQPIISAIVEQRVESREQR